MSTPRLFLIGLLLVLFCSFPSIAQKPKKNPKTNVLITSVKNGQGGSISVPLTASATKVPGIQCSNPNGLVTTEMEALLAAHNKERAEIGTPPLRWNCTLADLAQEWANKGVAQHREFSDYGENIFVAGDSKVAATDAVNKWLNERSQWNNANGSCAAGKTCTHYTQIVWKRTTQVGCGINRNAAGKWRVMLVCNYDPAGNTQPGSAF